MPLPLPLLLLLQRMQESVFDLPPWLSKDCKELICSMLQTGMHCAVLARETPVIVIAI